MSRGWSGTHEAGERGSYHDWQKHVNRTHARIMFRDARQKQFSIEMKADGTLKIGNHDYRGTIDRHMAHRLALLLFDYSELGTL